MIRLTLDRSIPRFVARSSKQSSNIPSALAVLLVQKRNVHSAKAASNNVVSNVDSNREKYDNWWGKLGDKEKERVFHACYGRNSTDGEISTLPLSVSSNVSNQKMLSQEEYKQQFLMSFEEYRTKYPEAEHALEDYNDYVKVAYNTYMRDLFGPSTTIF